LGGKGEQRKKLRIWRSKEKSERKQGGGVLTEVSSERKRRRQGEKDENGLKRLKSLKQKKLKQVERKKGWGNVAMGTKDHMKGKLTGGGKKS